MTTTRLGGIKMKTVYCPVIKSRINGTDCNVICDVADKMLKPRVLPKGIVWDYEAENICLNCKYHYCVEERKLKDGRNVVVAKKNNGTLIASADVDPEYWEFFEITKDDLADL